VYCDTVSFVNEITQALEERECRSGAAFHQDLPLARRVRAAWVPPEHGGPGRNSPHVGACHHRQQAGCEFHGRGYVIVMYPKEEYVGRIGWNGRSGRSGLLLSSIRKRRGASAASSCIAAQAPWVVRAEELPITDIADRS